MGDLGIEERGPDSQAGGNLTNEDATHGGSRRAQPLERQNEPHDRNDISQINELLHCLWGHCFFAFPVLNMCSMRSVMMKPPTMLLKEAATAINPSVVERRVLCPPAVNSISIEQIRSERMLRLHR